MLKGVFHNENPKPNLALETYLTVLKTDNILNIITFWMNERPVVFTSLWYVVILNRLFELCFYYVSMKTGCFLKIKVNMYFIFNEYTWRKFRNSDNGLLLFKTMKRKFINRQFNRADETVAWTYYLYEFICIICRVTWYI